MIQENELRIGNWVMWQGIHVRIATPTIFERTFNKIKEGRVSGIPLTPEILEKAGFECSGDTYMGGLVYYLKNIQWVYREEGVCFAMAYGFSLSHILYLHQLQNLYFALTGEELQIDL